MAGAIYRYTRFRPPGLGRLKKSTWKQRNWCMVEQDIAIDDIALGIAANRLAPPKPALGQMAHNTYYVNISCQRRRKIRQSRIFQTIQTASQMIRRFILLSPSVRSTKMMGISLMRNFRAHARDVTSIWKE